MRSPMKNFACLALLSAAAGSCLAWEIECPPNVRLESAYVLPGDIPSGFAPFVNSEDPLRLTGASMFDGPAGKSEPLKPASTPPGASPYEVKITWEQLNSAGREATLSCDYAYGMIRLIQKVERGSKTCTAIYQRQGSPSSLSIRFQCK